MEKKKKKIENLKKDKAKALQVAARTMAAHTNIKNYLDQEKERNQALQNNLVLMQKKVSEAEAERNEFEAKHNEMFSSVSALN